jgi:hypothetical protein
MRFDQSDPDAVVGRSREISEERWPDIKGELDSAKTIPVAEIAACTPLVETDDSGTFISIKRLFA